MAERTNLPIRGVSNFERETDDEMSSPSSAKASPSVFPGTTISGRVRVERLLGRGAMGSVWLARHLTLDVDVAVKFIDAAFRDQSDHRGRFALEARNRRVLRRCCQHIVPGKVVTATHRLRR